MRYIIKRVAARFGLFDSLRAMEQYTNLLLGRIHDPDYLEIPRTIGTSAIADIGANIGQSMISLRSLFPDNTIHAYEPNPACGKTLRQVAKKLGHGVSVFDYGISDASKSLEFYVPVLRSGIELLQEGSFDKGVFDQPITVERIAQPFTLKTQQCVLRTLDEVGTRYALIKIDVQGLELQVLKGAKALLRRDRPFVMLERDLRSEPDIDIFMKQFAYTSRVLTNNTLYIPPSGSCTPLMESPLSE